MFHNNNNNNEKEVTAASVSVNFFFNAPMMKLFLQLDSNRPGLPFLAGRVLHECACAADQGGAKKLERLTGRQGDGRVAGWSCCGI